MSVIQDSWQAHINIAEKAISLESVSEKQLSEWIKPLIDNITDDGAVPYLLGAGERYRASPLASTISWLEKANLLPVPVLIKMQEQLLVFRDQNVSYDPKNGIANKASEDMGGWSLGEGVSVWSTSCAIEALLDSHGCGINYADRFKSSVIWLANQRQSDGAWAYQLHNNCSTNVVMTSLALRSLALAYTEPNRTRFLFSAEDMRLLEQAITSGFNYIKENCTNEKKKAYWSFEGKPHCAATTWALMALRQINSCNAEISPNCTAFYEKIKDRALLFVCSQLPQKAERWADEPFVYEGGAKYAPQKNYVSFSATLLPQLFELGVSPFHPRVIAQIKWLIENPSDWKISTYDRGKICYFTYAMVLSSITSWYQRVGSALAPMLMNSTKTKIPKMLYGYNSMLKFQMQMVQPNRIKLFSLLLGFVLILLLLGKYIEGWSTQITTWLITLWNQTENERHDLAIGVISQFLQVGIAAVLLSFGALIKRIWRRFMHG